MLPFIAVPTTAGTGSECQSAALIADEQTHQKMACLDPKATARVAILDPALSVTQPPRVTACTGIDAIAHAVETAVAKKRNPLSLMYSHEAFKLSVHSLPEILVNPHDLAARGRMQLGAALAGLAIENSMLGAAHAAANPLTAHYGLVHGQVRLPLGVVHRDVGGGQQRPHRIHQQPISLQFGERFLQRCGIGPDGPGLSVGVAQRGRVDQHRRRGVQTPIDAVQPGGDEAAEREVWVA